MGSNNDGQLKPHFVLVPFPAQGHIIPMVDMAHLLAAHGATVTLVTTPLNADRLGPTIRRIAASGLSVTFLPLRFPCAEAGLPDGCENLDAVPSSNLLANFLDACAMLRDPLVSHLRRHGPPPDCVVADAGQTWTHDVALKLGVPRFSFNGFGCFALVCRHIFHYDKILDKLAATDDDDDDAPFVMPGLPQAIEMNKSCSPANFTGPGLERYRDVMMDLELAAAGSLVNSFHDLEADYFDRLGELRRMKIFTVGPMSIRSDNTADTAFRGEKAAIDEALCSRWLDSMRPNSVIYVSFGSLARTSPAQLAEIGLGLEATGCPFVWVIKAGSKSAEVEEWLAGGFEERNQGRGLIIRGWAPQLVILQHPAVGGFTTHCGWNSTVESVAAGVPMLTWPHFAEQFLNEKLIVEVLRIGVPIGVKEQVKWGSPEQDALLVDKEHIKQTVRRLMTSKTEEAVAIRARADELGKKARAAMEEGGSSHENLKLLIDQIREHMKNKNQQ